MPRNNYGPMNTDKPLFKIVVSSAFVCMILWPSLLAADDAAGARKAPAPAKSKAPATAPARKASSKAAPAAAVRRGPQMAPSRERYKQIQEALASKGFLAPAEATGQWTAASVDALK